MKRHKVLEHTADMRLLVQADTLENLFQAALQGMAELIKNTNEVYSEKIELKVAIESPDNTALLIDFLSEVLTLSHNNNAVFRSVTIDKLTDNKLTGTISGFKTDGFDDDIKAVTYHEAEIKTNDSGNLETMIVFDI